MSSSSGGATPSFKLSDSIYKSAVAIGVGATAINADQIIVQGKLIPRPGPIEYRLPQPPEPYVEPTEALSALWRVLEAGSVGPVGIMGSRAAGLLGMGGIGKSVLAGALAGDPRARVAFPHGAVWLAFGQDAEVRDKQDELLMALSGVRQASRDIYEAHGALCLLSEQLPGRLLVVLDDVWTFEGVCTAFADLPNIRLLVTSRDRRVLEALKAASLELDLLSPDAALGFLATAAGCERAKLPAESGEVVRRCGRLPLALAAAGALIRLGHYTWSEIVEALAQARLHEFGSKWLDEPLKRDLAAVVKISVDALTEAQHECLLDFAVLQEDVAVPEAALINLWSSPDRPTPVARLIARELADRSLLKDTGEQRYIVHDLYRDYLRDVAGDLGARHASIARRYARHCPTSWSAGPRDGYFFQHVVRHRAAAGEDIGDQLFDADWLLAKLPAAGLSSLISDYGLEKSVESEQATAALRLAARRLLHDERLLPVQLCGRLAGDFGDRLVGLLESLRRNAGPTLPMPLDDGFLDPAGRLERILSGHEGFVNGIAVSGDGRLTLSASEDRTLILWNLETGQLVRRYAGHDDGVNATAFLEHRDGFMSADEAGMVCLWSLHLSEPERRDPAGPGSIDRIVVLPDGWRAVLAGAADGLSLWDVARGQIIDRFGQEVGRVTCLASLPDGRVLSGGNKGAVCLWDPLAGRLIRSFPGHVDRIRGLGCVQAEVTAAAEGGTVLSWVLESGEELRRLITAPVEGPAVAFLADGETAASGMNDGSLSLWGLKDARPKDRIEAHGNVLSAIERHPDGTRLITGSHDETLRLWNLAAPPARAISRGCSSAIQAIAATRDGTWIVTGCEDGFARLWAEDRPEVVDEVSGHEGIIRALALLDDRLCVFGGDAGQIRVWDIRSRQTRTEIPTRLGLINRLLAINETRVLVGSGGGVVSLWNVETRSGSPFAKRHEATVTSMKLMPKGKAVTGGADGVVCVWDLASGEQVLVIRGHRAAVQGLAVLQEGRGLISGSADGEVRLWNLDDRRWRPLAESRFARDPARQYHLAPPVMDIQALTDSNHIVIAGGDNALNIWSVSQDTEVASFVDDHPIAATTLAADSQRLYAGNLLGRIHRFDFAAILAKTPAARGARA